jgi:autotransporter-associated beta strand protein
MIKTLTSMAKRSAVLLGLIAATQTQAQVITNSLPLYEAFNYASNNERLGVAAGFNSVNWAVSLNSSGTGSAVITNGFTNEVTYVGLPAPVGNLLCVTPVSPSSGRNRGMSFPLQTLSAANPTIYYSFLLNVKANPGLLKPIFALSTSQSSLATPMTVFLTDAGKLAIGKNSSSAATVTNSTALATGTHLVVLRYRFVSGSSNDEFDLWIDPGSLGAPESSLPATTNLITFSGSDATTLGSIALVHPAISPTSPGNFYIDELRIGTNWAQVTPSGCTPGTAYSMSGGGSICAGDPGVLIGLTNSETGLDYQLKLAGSNVGSPVPGSSGSAISFGLQAAAGTYTVVASNTATLCVGSMNGSATVTVNTSPGISTQPSAATVPVGGSVSFSVVGTGAGLSYQWQHDGTNISNGGNISGATSNILTLNPVSLTDASPQPNGYEVVISGTCTPSTNSARVALTVTVPNNLTWVGDGSANLWDTSTANWTGDATVFVSNDNATFTDSGSASPAVDLVGVISPNSVTVNSSQNYTIGTTTTGSLGGVATLTKSGSGTLTLSTANSFTGKATVTGGTLSIATGSNLGTAPGAFVADQLTLNGGALQVTASGSVNANRGVTLGASGGTMDVPTGIIFTNTPITTGAGSLTKINTGTLTLPVANSYVGGTVISNGTLVALNGSSLGTGTATLAGGTLTFPATTTIANSLAVTADSILTFASTANNAVQLNGTGFTGVSGRTLTITPTGASTTGTRVRVNNGLTNSFTFDANLVLNGTFTFATYNNDGDEIYNGVISGAGTLGRRSPSAGVAGRTILNGNNTYTGGTVIADGAIGFGIDSTGSPVTSGPVGTGAITLENNPGTLHRLYASGGARTVGNNITWPAGVNQDLTIEGANALTLNGTVDLGAATRALVANNAANTTIGGVIINGGLVKTGAGVLLLNGTNTYTGSTTVSNGVLGGVGILVSPLTVDVAGTLSPGVSGIGTLVVSNNLTLLGNTAVDINKTAMTSDLVDGIATATYGGTLTINNLAGTLVASDSFTLFNATAHSGTITNFSPATPGAGLVWSFANGVLSVATAVMVNTNSTNIVYSVSGPNEILCWPTDHIGWRLQVQTNSLAVGLGTNWVDVAVPNGYSCFTNTLNPANQAVFYRMVYP